MAELKLNVTADGVDLELVGDDLAIDYGLVSTIYAMLFTDARVEGLDPTVDPRGYPFEEPGAAWGSKLWTLERAKREPQTLVLARQYAQEGLAPLVSEGIAASVTVRAEFGDPKTFLFLEVTITRSTDRRWSTVWRGQEDATITNGPTAIRLLFR